MTVTATYDGKSITGMTTIAVSFAEPTPETVIVTLNYPEYLEWPSRTVQVAYGGTLAIDEIPVKIGFVVDPYNTTIPESFTSDGTIDVKILLEMPTINEVSVSYDDGVAYIEVIADHPLEEAELKYYIDPLEMSSDNVFNVSESGTYVVHVGSEYMGISSIDADSQIIVIEIPSADHPVIVPPVDDDDYVPLPPQIVVEDDGDDDTVKVAACAAAAVAAAIIALILVAEYRKN